LVLFMTLPGLALFYGGLVRRKNVLSVLAQCLLITGMVTILWWLCGYSMAFHSGNSSFDIGGSWALPSFNNVTSARTPIIPTGFRTTCLRCTN
jgi:Amt family ammonium transporter